jgi:uncharacterized protein (DUF2236 family)
MKPARGALYDSSSLAWKLNSESLVLLGGPRAAILQVCDPGVAAGVAEYSTYKKDPFGRLTRTLNAMLAISFGSEEARERMLARLERIHSHVKGSLADGSSYSALDADRQMWVLATLTDTVIEVDRRYGGKMKEVDREIYYRETKATAGAFGVPDDLVPDDLSAFRDYFAEKVATLGPTEDSRDIAKTLMYPRMRPLPRRTLVPFSMITKDLMPARLLAELGFSRLSPAELGTVRAAQVVLRNSVAHVSGSILSNPLNSRAVQRAA